MFIGDLKLAIIPSSLVWTQLDTPCSDITVLVMTYGISNTIVLEIP